jgi:hypothetical protein
MPCVRCFACIPQAAASASREHRRSA